MNQTDEILSIDTPENVVFDYSLAGLGSRFLAALVDTLFIGLLQVVTLLPILYLLFQDNFFSEETSAWAIGLLGLVSFVFLWGYYILFEVIWNGQSPGKRMVGIRVIRRDGTPVTLTEVLIRNLVRIVDMLPTAYGVGVVAMFIDKYSRRLGDMAAGTLVIHDSGPLSMESMSPQRDSQTLTSLTQPDLLDFPVAQLTNSDLQFLEEYIDRRHSLPNRLELGRQVLKRLYTRVGKPEHPLPEQPDLLLNAIMKAARAKNTE